MGRYIMKKLNEIISEVINRLVEKKENKWLRQSDGKPWKTDKNKKVPSKCPKCGADMSIRLKGEPIFECINGHYFGTLKFNLK